MPSKLPLLLCTSAVLTSAGLAADGTFNQATAGTYSWDTPENWVGSETANGSGFTAFLTSGSTGTIAVTIDTPRTIGNITASGHFWNVQGSGTLTLAGGSTPVLTGPTQSLSISVTLDGTQGLSTAGSVTLAGNNLYTGVTTVAAASTLTLTSSGALGAVGAGNTTTIGNGGQMVVHNATITGEVLTINGGGAGSNNGSLQGRGTAAWAGDIVIGNASSRIGTFDASSQLTVSGVISGAQPLFLSGLGTTVLSGSNTFTGATTVYRGTLKLDGGNNRLPTGTLVTMGGTADNSLLDLNGWNQQITGLANGSNASTRTVTNSAVTASTLTLDGTTARDFTGTGNTSITGNLSLVKNGGYTQTLAESNSYRGNTTINLGTLVLADDSTMTFYIGADGVNNGILGAGDLTLNGDFLFNLDDAVLAANNSWNIIAVGTLGETFGSTFTVQGFTETAPDSRVWASGNLRFSELTGILTVVPEPATGLLVAGGLAAMRISRRRRG